MCVTFTGCELLCSGAVDWQQQSHATLKSELRVQIRMKFYEGFKRKGLFGLRLHQANERVRRESVRRFGFSQWVWGRPQSGSASSGEDTTSLATPPAPRPCRTRNVWSRSDCCSLTLLCLEGEELWGLGWGFPGRWIWKPQSHPRVLLYDCGEKPSAQEEENSPWEGGGCFPMFAIELKWNKDRLNIWAKIIYKNFSRWTSRWVGGGGGD